MSVRSARRAARVNPFRRIALWVTIGVVSVGALVAIAVANRTVPQIATSAPPISTLAKGDVAPEFSATTSQGAFDLASAPTPVFLEVFATWCPHCQRETAVLNRLYAKYGRRLAFVAVTGSPYASDRVSTESEADVLAFGRYFNVRYPLAYDPSLSVANHYLQGGFPTIAIIGTDKRVRFVGSGEVPETTLESQIRRAL